MIRVRMHKTSKVVVIPLTSIAKDIIKKYKGDFPNKKNTGTFNSDIKNIGRVSGINTKVVIFSKKRN